MKTIPKPNTPKSAKPSPKKSFAMMKLLPISLWTPILIGCPSSIATDAKEDLSSIATDAKEDHLPPKRMKNPKFAILLLGLSLCLLTGCAHYKVISADKTVRRLKAQQLFTAPGDGWFVPDARWLELREALAEKIEGLEHSN